MFLRKKLRGWRERAEHFFHERERFSFYEEEAVCVFKGPAPETLGFTFFGVPEG